MDMINHNGRDYAFAEDVVRQYNINREKLKKPGKNGRLRVCDLCKKLGTDIVVLHDEGNVKAVVYTDALVHYVKSLLKRSFAPCKNGSSNRGYYKTRAALFVRTMIDLGLMQPEENPFMKAEEAKEEGKKSHGPAPSGVFKDMPEASYTAVKEKAKEDIIVSLGDEDSEDKPKAKRTAKPQKPVEDRVLELLQRIRRREELNEKDRATIERLMKDQKNQTKKVRELLAQAQDLMTA